MAYSLNKYTGTGVPQILVVPPYISRDHITVTVNDVLVVPVWVSPTTLQLTAAVGAAVRVIRKSSPAVRLTDYVEGVPLTEEVLDVDSKQAFYLSQEQLDETSEALATFGASNFTGVAASIRTDAVAAATVAGNTAATNAIASVTATAAADATAKANAAAAASAPSGHVGAGGTAHASATASVPGFMSVADKVKLDGYGATPVTSVAGRTGAVVLTKTDVGLANVDNTTDAAKPVSTAQATADTAVQTAAAADATAKANARQAPLTAGTDYLAPLGTSTVTNKRITARVGSAASSATPTINTDNVDIYKLTAQAVAITSFTSGLTGTPVDNDMLLIQITGTAAVAITWGTSFEASTVALPTTTVTTAMLAVAFIWNTATSKWRCVAAV